MFILFQRKPQKKAINQSATLSQSNYLFGECTQWMAFIKRAHTWCELGSEWFTSQVLSVNGTAASRRAAWRLHRRSSGWRLPTAQKVYRKCSVRAFVKVNTVFFFSLLRIQDWQKKVFWHLLQNLKRLMSRRKDQYLYLKQRWAN